MSDDRLRYRLANLGRALARLEEALAAPIDPRKLALDATIQRFEFTFELFWQTLRVMLARDGMEAGTPRESLKQGVAAGWLEDEQLWLDMLRCRNETSRVYDESRARAIYDRITSFLPALRRGHAFFLDKVQQDPGS